ADDRRNLGRAAWRRLRRDPRQLLRAGRQLTARHRPCRPRARRLLARPFARLRALRSADRRRSRAARPWRPRRARRRRAARAQERAQAGAAPRPARASARGGAMRAAYEIDASVPAVAVVGVAGRFGVAGGVEGLWDVLVSG